MWNSSLPSEVTGGGTLSAAAAGREGVRDKLRSGRMAATAGALRKRHPVAKAGYPASLRPIFDDHNRLFTKSLQGPVPIGDLAIFSLLEKKDI